MILTRSVTMKQIMKALLLTVLALALALPALAEGVSFDGQVTAAYTQDVYTDYTGIIGRVNVQPGDRVEAETQVAALRTVKVCAEADGTVAAVLVQPGDSVDAITQRCGAALYIDDGVHYTVAASNEGSKAYDSASSRRVQPGETVYLRSRSDESSTGVGRVTIVDGSSYTVEVTSGTFIPGKTVNIYRDAAFTESQRIGQGEIAGKAPEGVSASGRVVSVAVKPGDTVRKGDLLLETLEGGANGTDITAQLLAGTSGVVAEVLIAQGDSVSEGTRIASIWPDEAMQITVSIPESDLGEISVGRPVDIAFDWNRDAAKPLRGTVTSIAFAAGSTGTGVAYVAAIAFTPDENVRYGMNVTVTPVN